MSQSILYSKSLNSDIPVTEFKLFRRKLRIYCGLSWILILVLIVFCIVFALLWFGVINKQSVVTLNRILKVKCGLVEGKLNDGIVEFLGIPYAFPPTEQRRFCHAQEILDSKGCAQIYGSDSSKPYQTQNYKSQCMQYDKSSDNLTGNEDCLYLNVYTPSTNPDRKLPVIFIISSLFFIYGSGNMAGFVVLPEVVKATKAIHVTSNYRLGPMNSIINPQNNETNHGLSDQLLALTWIQKNIAVFGGDSSNVILYGVGSGSTLALALYNSNKALNLFSKIWISNPVTSIMTTLENGLKSQEIHLSNEKNIELFKNTLTVDKIFRNWTQENVDKILTDRWFTFPTPDVRGIADDNVHFLLIDNDFITESNILKRRSRNRNIPLVVGNNANEVDIFPSPSDLRFWVSEYFKTFIKLKMEKFSKKVNESFVESFNENYVKDGQASAEDSYTKIVTDIRITCPLNSLLQKFMDYSNSQLIYRYILEDSHEYFDYFDMKYSNILAAHGWDNILYFHGYKTHMDYGRYGPKEKTMSRILNQAMQDFAWNNELKDMNASKDGHILLNLIKNGKINKECYLKINECKLWEKELGNIEGFVWSA